jgi:hypothetical protein
MWIRSVKRRLDLYFDSPLPWGTCHFSATTVPSIAAPDAIRVLSSGLSSDLTIARTGERELEIEAQGGFITNTLDRLYRGLTDPMAQGQRIVLSDMVAEVLTLTQDQRP